MTLLNDSFWTPTAVIRQARAGFYSFLKIFLKIAGTPRDSLHVAQFVGLFLPLRSFATDLPSFKDWGVHQTPLNDTVKEAGGWEWRNTAIHQAMAANKQPVGDRWGSNVAPFNDSPEARRSPLFTKV